MRLTINVTKHMGIVVRQSIKSVIITLVGVLMGGAIAVLSTRYFAKPDLGFRENLIKVSIMVSYLGLFGFNYTLLIYGQKYPPGHSARGTFLGVSALATFLLTLVVAASYFVAKPYIAHIYRKPEDAAMVREYFVLFPLLTFFTVGIAWFEGYLQSLHKTALQNFAREILARVIYISLIVLYAMGWIDFGTFVWAYVILYLIPLGFLFYFSYRSPGFVFELKRGVLDRSEIKEILRFSGYHMLTVVSTILILQLDVILLAPLDRDGFEVVAVYSVATLAVSMLRNPTRIIGIAATPAFTHAYNKGDMSMLKSLFHRSSVNMQIIGCCMIALVYLNIDNIQSVMYLIKDGYGQIKWLIMILMIGQLADMVTGLNFELIGVTKHYRFNFWVALFFMAIVLVLNFWLIRIYGIYGAAWATTLGLIAFNVAKYLFLWAKMRMQSFGKHTVVIAAIVSLASALAWAIPDIPSVWLDILVRSGLFCGLTWWALYRAKVSPELSEITRNLFRKGKLF